MFVDDLTDKDLRRLEKLGSLRRIEAGEHIIEEGSQGSVFSLILSGEVEVQKKVTEGQSTAVIKLGACDVIGEMGFFGIPGRSASVVALTDCEILEFNPDQFDEFALARPKIGLILYRNLARILAGRLAETDKKLQNAVLWTLTPLHSKKASEAMSIRQNSSLKFWG